MKCRRVRKLLSVFMDGEIDAVQGKEVERHIDSCSECAKELASLKVAMERLRSFGDAEASPDFVGSVMARVAEEHRTAHRFGLSRRVADYFESIFRRPASQFAVLALAALLIAFEVGAWAAGTILSRPAVDPMSDDPHSAVTLQLRKIRKQAQVKISSSSIGGRSETETLVVFPEVEKRAG
jgi:anti-sigma factor RsiW